MGIQDEIEEYLRQGYTPQQLIDMGHKKSTVYKVYSALKSYVMPTTRPEWVIENVMPWPLRCLPGQTLSMSFSFKNTSDQDIYLYRIGTHFEWMITPYEWFAQDVKDLVKPNQRHLFTFLVPVPRNIPLGEYEILFGIEAQSLPPTGNLDQSRQTLWSEPLIFHVKHPITGIKVFISHSTEDTQIVRELEKRLDNYGIEPIIAEDIPEPGTVLEEKFKAKIRESNIFLALLTESSARSKWVIMETEYARSIQKPVIPLKERSLRVESPIEWIGFSRGENADAIFPRVMEAIRFNTRNQPGLSPIGIVLGIGVLAFIAALLSSD
jgi:hypothetical protein